MKFPRGDGASKITRYFFSRVTRTFFFFARYWIRTQRFRNLISFAFLFEKCIDPSPPSTNNCCRLHLLHFCFPVVFPFFLFFFYIHRFLSLSLFFFNFSISYVTENIFSSLSISFQICIYNSIFDFVQFLFHRPILLTFHFF